jgi:hypothetical protein
VLLYRVENRTSLGFRRRQRGCSGGAERLFFGVEGISVTLIGEVG